MRLVTNDPDDPTSINQRDCFPVLRDKDRILQYIEDRINSIEYRYEVLEPMERRFGAAERLDGAVEELNRLQAFISGLR